MSFSLGCITVLLVYFCIHYIFGFDKLGLKATAQKQESIQCSLSLDITSYENVHKFKDSVIVYDTLVILISWCHFLVPSYIDLSMGFCNKRSCLCCVACCVVRSCSTKPWPFIKIWNGYMPADAPVQHLGRVPVREPVGS